MSNRDRFVLPNETVNRNPRQAFQFDTDVLQGFKDAVSNNQMQLALSYLTFVVDVLAGLEVEGDAPKTLGKKTPSTKAAASKELTADAE